jgi:DNA-binding Lrp family transcriptional regulator
MRAYSTLEQRLLNDFQHSLPLSLAPYADIAEQLDVDETTVISTLQQLQQEGVISRVGAVFKPNRVGVSTLAAMAVPADELEEVAGLVSGFDEVNHNYEREHHFNLWFVIATTDSNRLQQVLQEIEQRTGYAVVELPMRDDYYIDLGFELRWT